MKITEFLKKLISHLGCYGSEINLKLFSDGSGSFEMKDSGVITVNGIYLQWSSLTNMNEVLTRAVKAMTPLPEVIEFEL